jgi:dCTP deaminase
MPATPGVLTDDDIRREADQGRLIAENFSPVNVRQACYELRAGDVYYELSGEKKRIVLKTPDDFVLLKPYQLAVIITLETLDMPADVIGRVLMKGKLFSLGLVPVNTYADPGFSGRLGIVIYNASPRYIRISQGEAIAKMEFERLHAPVRKPYTGQHGYQTEIWPIPDHMILPVEQARRDPRVADFGAELSRSFGDDFGRLVDRVFRYERVMFLSVLAYLGLATVIIIYSEASGARLSTLVAIALGLATNVASGVIMYVATNIHRWRR